MFTLFEKLCENMWVHCCYVLYDGVIRKTLTLVAIETFIINDFND